MLSMCKNSQNLGNLHEIKHVHRKDLSILSTWSECRKYVSECQIIIEIIL